MQRQETKYTKCHHHRSHSPTSVCTLTQQTNCCALPIAAPVELLGAGSARQWPVAGMMSDSDTAKEKKSGSEKFHQHRHRRTILP